MGTSSVHPEPGWEDLARQVEELQRRVVKLELRLGETVEAAAPRHDVATLPSTPSLEDTTNALPVLGTALLGVAGAYLLRAFTEYGTIPRAAGVAAGILYALLWLFLAARTAAEKRLTVALYGLTSVLVLSPLLWETTVRFQAIPPWAAAVVLTLFSGFGLGVSWRKNIASVAWITTLAGVAMSMVLLMATHDVVPFAVALLAIAALVEFSACWDHWMGERWLVALAADFTVLFVAYLVTREAGLPEGYAALSTATALALQVGLLLVYLGSTIVRTLLRGLDFTFFETAQTVVAFLISLGGAMRIAHGHPAAAAAIGTFSLTGGVACYVVAFAFLERRAANSRNLYTYSTFALLLVLAGSRLLLSGLMQAAAGSALALGCLWIGGHAHRTTVRWHGALYLLLTALASGLVAASKGALFNTGSTGGPFDSSALICAVAVAASYAIVLAEKAHDDEHWGDLMPDLAVSVLLVWSVAGVISWLLLSVPVPVSGAVAATVRTFVLTALSVVTLWAGRRWKRLELLWMVPVLMVAGGYKLLTQDLQQEHTLSLFVSLLLYGGVLVLLPRIQQKAKTG